jgi:hypothetical protein
MVRQFAWMVSQHSMLRPLTKFNPDSYTGDDPIGVELAGALKNIFAIATGIVAGLGFDQNARAGTLNPLDVANTGANALFP